MKINLKLFFISLCVLLINNQAFSQKKNDNTTYFWFNVKIFNKFEKQTHLKEYALRTISPKISNGNSKAFSKALWSGAVKGTSIAVGPFKSYSEAEYAYSLYKIVNDTIKERPTDIKYSWFLVKVNIAERSHSYKFERMAARVADGTAKDFSEVMRESLAFKALVIGPFKDAIDAEEAKTIYRLEE
ncbi:MAG: hypothetical protein MJ211_00580 [Bacteroidales bacterium]|nr:hypothetical protein [Bacteroidales bacterium]